MTMFDLVTIVGACLSGLCVIAFFSMATMINHQKDREKIREKIDAELKEDLERYYDQLNREAEHEDILDVDQPPIIDVTNFAEEVTK